MGDTEVTIMNGNGPDIDQDVQTQVHHLVQGEDERVYVVWQTLKEAVHGVKGMACEGSSDLPDVMRLMDVLIHKPVMKASVDPVDQHVSEEEEGQHTDDKLIPATGEASDVIVQLAIPAQLQQEQHDRGDAHPRQCLDRKHDLSIDLVL